MIHDPKDQLVKWSQVGVMLAETIKMIRGNTKIRIPKTMNDHSTPTFNMIIKKVIRDEKINKKPGQSQFAKANRLMDRPVALRAKRTTINSGAFGDSEIAMRKRYK